MKTWGGWLMFTPFDPYHGADRLSMACRRPFATCRRPAGTTVINLAARTNANTVSSSRFTLAA